ncbi:MAG TPA: serine/threonine-protein kinase, partial [bacterium]|nr:serine/threonine-protein kinase [bacterium]
MKKITDIIKRSLKNEPTRTVSIDPDSIIASLAESTILAEKKDDWKYRIEDEIGRGGIGRVLIAFDEKVGREIALKELIKEDNPGSVTVAPLDKMKADEIRFLREAKVTGQLEHPGIVPVYEIGRKPDGNHYYTMRLVRGVTLSQAIYDAGTLQKRLRLLPHFRDICNAIAYSHSRGVIHRDIKPENIMIGEFGETVVLDWGLAKVKGEADQAEGELREELNLLKVDNIGKTLKGKAIGTPAYMSPEQANGEISEIDERSDIYSLGAVLYEILTGHAPFKGRDVKETLEMVKLNTPVEITIFEPEAPP